VSELALALVVVTAYTGALVAVAEWAERQEARGRPIASNALVYSLSLGVYATAWTYYGSVGLAARNGVLFLTVYLGPTLCAVLWRWVLRRLIQVQERYHITGIADLLALRYHQHREIDDGRTQVGGNARTHLLPFLNNEPVSGQDLVVWYGAHFRHAVSDEPDPNDNDHHEVGPTLQPFNWPGA